MQRSRFDLLATPILIVAAALSGCDRPDQGGHATPPQPIEGIDPSQFVASGMIEEAIRKETTVKAPVREVFERMTTEAGIKKTLLVDSHVDLRIGGPWELYFSEKADPGDRGSEGSRILSYVPNRMLSVAMSAPRQFTEERRKRTWIVITFDPIGEDQTFVRLVHLGFGAGGRWDELKRNFEQSWTAALRRLSEAFSPPKLPRPATNPQPPR